MSQKSCQLLDAGHAAGMGEAAKQFRRVNGHLHLPALRVAPDRHATDAVTPTCETDHEAA